MFVLNRSYLFFFPACICDLWTFANSSLDTVVGASGVAVRTMVPKAQGGPMDHRQHHLQAPLKAVHHPPILRPEYLQLQIRLLCPRLCP
jgi:hypothetical protein